MHRVVWRTFWPDDPLRNGETIDHIDRNEFNNALHNLRRATHSNQTRNQDRPSADDQARPRTPVLAWKDGEARATAERFVSLSAAERALNERFGTTKFVQANISRSARSDGRVKCNHWRFAHMPETDEEIAAREAQRARVLAAIAALREAAAQCASLPPGWVPSDDEDF